MLRFICLLLLILSCQPFASAQNPLFDRLEFGPYDVGYKLIKSYDLTRSLLKEQLTLSEDQQKGRAVPVYFWYPAEVSGTSWPMTFKDYLMDWAFVWNYNLPESEIEKEAWKQCKNYFFDVEETALRQFFEIELKSKGSRDANPASGKFPLVTFSHGHIDRWWIWGEFLASHGIAVVATSNSGSREKRHEMGISGLEAQIRDAEHAIAEAARHDFIDGRRVFAAGSSYGSLTAAGLAARNSNVKSVISLDGIIADWNEGELLQRTPYWDYQLFRTPILHINSGVSYSSNYVWMDQMVYADQYRIEMKELRHEDYHFHGMADLFGVNLNGQDLKDNSAGFADLTQTVLNFINSIITKRDPLSQLHETNQQVDFKQALPPSKSVGELLQILKEGGYESVRDVHMIMKNNHKQPFSMITYYDFGVMLHRYRLLQEEIEWFELSLDSYPNWSEAVYRLARLASLTGNEEKGQKMLDDARQAVEADPYLNADRKAYLVSRIERFTQ